MKSTNTFGVKFIARKVGATSEVLIYARITVNKRRSEISLKKTIPAAFWDSKTGQARGNKEAMKQWNPYIQDVRFKITECYRQLQLAHKPLTADTVKALFLGEEASDHTICSLMTYHNTNMKAMLAPGTLKNYSATERYVKLFLEKKQRRSDIYLSELNYQFITEFEIFLRKTEPLDSSNPLTNNGIMKHMERLKKMVTLAAKMEWISRDPFQRYSLRFQKVDKAFLATSELATVEIQVLPVHKLNLARDLFVFSCYTGLSYIDLVNLKPSNIGIGADGEAWIFTYRQKTDIAVRVPLLPVASALIERYRHDPRAVSKGVVFPYLTNQKVNAYLKDIAFACSIEKEFSFHMARHTFATTVTLTNGVPIETVSRMLGHTKLSTTQIYARVLEKKVSEDMQQLRKRLNKPKDDGDAQQKAS